MTWHDVNNSSSSSVKLDDASVSLVMMMMMSQHNTADVMSYRCDVSFDVIRQRYLTRVYRSVYAVTGRRAIV